MEKLAQVVFAHPEWETHGDNYATCIVTLYNKSNQDIVNPAITFETNLSQSVSVVNNFTVTSHDGTVVSGHLTDNNAIPANGYVIFSVGINVGSGNVGELPFNFTVNGESATVPEDHEKPSMPVGLEVTFVGAKQAEFTWEASTDNLLVSKYIVTYALLGVGGAHTAESNTNSITLSGLTPESNYYMYVTAVDIAGNLSAFSEALNFSTLSALRDNGPHPFAAAPYIDYMSTPNRTLIETFNASGIKNFMVAFVQPAIVNGQVIPAWGGQADEDFDARTSTYGHEDFNAIRNKAGNLAISFGGASGQILEEVVTDIDTIAGMYNDVLTHYNLLFIDFDFEGEALGNVEAMGRHIKAIETLMRLRPAVMVSYTLPVDGQEGEGGSGLSSIGEAFITRLAAAGIIPSLINGMTMDFGQLAPDDMFDGIQLALESLHSQIAKAWPEFGTAEQVWRRMGATPMFGPNDTDAPDKRQVFTLENQQQLLDYVDQRNIGMLSGWSVNRDYDLGDGVNLPYCEIILKHTHK